MARDLSTILFVSQWPESGYFGIMVRAVVTCYTATCSDLVMGFFCCLSIGMEL